MPGKVRGSNVGGSLRVCKRDQGFDDKRMAAEWRFFLAPSPPFLNFSLGNEHRHLYTTGPKSIQGRKS